MKFKARYNNKRLDEKEYKIVEKLFNPIISQAIRETKLDVLIEFFIKNPEHINCYTPFAGGTWLHFASGENSVDVVKVLLDIGFDPNKGDIMDGSLPIVSACHRKNFEIALILLEAGSKLDTSGEYSASNPLFAAIQGGSTEIVELFLQSGIDTSRKYGEDGNIDALAFAILYGQSEIAEVLALHNADNNHAHAQELILQAKEAIKSLGGLNKIQILPDS